MNHTTSSLKCLSRFFFLTFLFYLCRSLDLQGGFDFFKMYRLGRLISSSFLYSEVRLVCCVCNAGFVLNVSGERGARVLEHRLHHALDGGWSGVSVTRIVKGLEEEVLRFSQSSG